MTYQIPDPIPWDRLVAPLITAEDAVAKLDERLRTSPIRDGFLARSHFDDACASLWLAGELVSLEDLVLHDAAMDVHTPTHALTRAHTILRRRRFFADAKPDSVQNIAGLAILRGRGPGRATDDERDLTPEFAEIDTVLARSSAALARATAERDPLIYDPDFDEAARLADWQNVVASTEKFPPVLSAAIALDAWDTFEPLQHEFWLGPLLVAALLRARHKTRDLLCLNVGLRAVPRARRRALDPITRLVAFLDACAAAASAGLKEHDRLMLARGQLLGRLNHRRATSHLAALIDLVLARPLVSTSLIAKDLGITARAAQNLVTELALREVTGRGRYRAWAI